MFLSVPIWKDDADYVSELETTLQKRYAWQCIHFDAFVPLDPSVPLGPKSTPGNGWKPCDRGSRPEITDFLERLPDSFLLHTKHSNRSETYGDGPWISYQLYPIIIVIIIIIVVIIVIVTIRILIATIQVLTVSLTALQLVAAPCFKSRP